MKAITTAGHAVLFAGTTVVIALLGLVAMGQRLMTGVAIGASVTVLVTMIAAVTLLPAFLGFTGHKINSLRLPRRTSRRHEPAGAPPRERRTPAERWAGVVQRKPLVAAILAGAAPAGAGRPRAVDAAEPARRQRPAARPEQLHLVRDPLRGLRSRLRRTDDLRHRGRPPQTPICVPLSMRSARPTGIAYVTQPRISEDGQAATFMAFPTTGYQDEATTDLVHTAP